MTQLRGWKARRSGAGITIEGTDATGRPARFAMVETITVDEQGRIIAEGPRCGPFELLAAAAARVGAGLDAV